MAQAALPQVLDRRHERSPLRARQFAPAPPAAARAQALVGAISLQALDGNTSAGRMPAALAALRRNPAYGGKRNRRRLGIEARGAARQSKQHYRQQHPYDSPKISQVDAPDLRAYVT